MIVRRYSVDAEEITSPVRLAVITDFHGCRYGEGASELIAAVEAEAPDVVLLVGDILDDELPHDQSVALMQGLSRSYPCYYVTGNHEYWTEDIAGVLATVASCGVTTLDVDCVTIDVGGQPLTLCGIPDPYAMVYAGAPDTKTQLQLLAQQSAGVGFTVLLAHRPELIDRYAASDFDLVVSGHTHGGQVRIPGLLNGLYAPNQGWFPRYAGGKYRVGETTLIVSRGLARESTRLPRIFNRPELVVIDLE